jgi:transcriptional regulator with XRE-family HTH domain
VAYPSGLQTPTLSRLELAAALRRHRNTVGMTSNDVCTRLGFSTSKLSRLETGTRPIGSVDLDALCALYELGDDERARLTQLAAGSRRTGPRGQTNSTATAYMELEQSAYRIDDYKTSTVTALLQTPDYTRAFFRGVDPYLSNDTLDETVAQRLGRQNELFGRADPPQLNFILDEGVLRREVGGRAVMSGQLLRLMELVALPKVSIRVIPFAAGAHLGMDSLFTILQFREAVRDRVYIDAFELFLYVTEARQFARYRQAFDQLAQSALSGADSLDLIRSVAAQLT